MSTQSPAAAPSFSGLCVGADVGDKVATGLGVGGSLGISDGAGVARHPVIASEYVWGSINCVPLTRTVYREPV